MQGQDVETRDGDISITQVAGWLRPFSLAVQSQGLDSAQLLRRAGIDAGLMDQEGARLPASKMDQLWRLAIREGADLALGLDYARFFQPGNLYVLAFGLYASANLQQATEHLRLPLRLLTYAAIIDCHVSDGEFHVEVTPTYNNSVREKQIFFHAVLLGIWRSLAHPDLRPSRLMLREISAPHDDAVWSRIAQHFGCPVEFDAPCSRLSLPIAVAQQALHASNARLVEQGEHIIRQHLTLLDHQTVLDDIVQQVISKLSSGRCDRDTVARELGISVSTLQRRLAAENTSFKELLNKTRRDLAEHYLRATPRPIKDVAYSLGFADLSNFTRAFRGWFGMSPRQFRQQFHEQLLAPE